jgi:cobalt-zinc-cadmium efflux system membrane fusion protein
MNTYKTSFLLLLSSLFFACSEEKATEAEVSSAPVTSIKVSDEASKNITTVAADSINDFSRFNTVGEISFDEDKVAKVFPLAGGFVKELKVELGDYVQKGQTLAVIRSPEIAGFTKLFC